MSCSKRLGYINLGSTMFQVHHLFFILLGLVIGLSLPSSFHGIGTNAGLINYFNAAAAAPTISSSCDHHIKLEDMKEEELLWRASLQACRMDDHKVPFDEFAVPKVAFMFLTKGPLPLAPLWEIFFKAHQGFYNIYVHSSPTFNASNSLPPDSVFYARTIPTKEVEWGKASMMDAERRLLASALLDDKTNQRFVLLSESCIPLYNFTTIYNYLIITNSNRSFIDSGKNNMERYNPNMSPAINITHWRKGSQWFEANRHAAVRIVSDRKYYNLFTQFCRAPCYMDEHYIPTLVNMVMVAGENANRSVTWVDWSPTRKSRAHPTAFGSGHVSEELLRRIRLAVHDTATNTTSTTSSSMRYLFARKFLYTSLQPLLRIAPLFWATAD